MDPETGPKNISIKSTCILCKSFPKLKLITAKFGQAFSAHKVANKKLETFYREYR
jgi:hypothetical protein